MILGLPLGSHLATIGTIIGWKRDTFCRRAPRRVPGSDLEPILGGFGKYVATYLTLFFNVFGLILTVFSRSRRLPKSTIWLLYQVLSVSGHGGNLRQGLGVDIQ